MDDIIRKKAEIYDIQVQINLLRILTQQKLNELNQLEQQKNKQNGG